MIKRLAWKKGLKDFFSNPMIAAFVLVALAMTAMPVFAEDLLKGTETDLFDTINGTGKKFLYLTEILIALGTYIKTKNMWVLTGVITIAIAFDIFLKVAGF